MKFRNISLLWAAFVLVLFAGLFAFDKTSVRYDTPVQFEDEAGGVETQFFAGSAQQKIYALDTMSVASTTYITVPWNMSSPYQYQYFFKMRKLVGTPNVKIRLEERNASNSAIWSAIDSVSVSGADSLKLHFRLRGSIAYGAFQRIAFVKTGTNTMARNVEFNIKPTN